MTTPQVALSVLDGIRQEMDLLSVGLAKTARDFQPIAEEYEKFMADHELGLWEASVDGAKLPPKPIRERLAHRDMPPELYGKYTALKASIDRMIARISTLKHEANAQRSVLSALREGVI